MRAKGCLRGIFVGCDKVTRCTFCLEYLADKLSQSSCRAGWFGHAADQQHHRSRAKRPHRHEAPTTYAATAANQVWSWDITYLPSPVRGKFYYLYLIEDIYSRKAVGWEVYEAENGEKAAVLLQRSVTREKCWRQPLVLHSDNGAPMKSVTLLTKMYDLGITPSKGRPRVSNDNPYSEVAV